MPAKFLLALVCAAAFTGCASHGIPARANMPPREPVSSPSSTEATTVTVADNTEISVWEDMDGPLDQNYDYLTFWSNGARKGRWHMWNGAVKVFQCFDRRGRLRYSEADHLVSVVDLSAVKPEAFERELRSPSLWSVYIVGNRSVCDDDVLKLYANDRIEWMIVERCPNVSRATKRAIKSKLVREFPNT